MKRRTFLGAQAAGMAALSWAGSSLPANANPLTTSKPGELGINAFNQLTGARSDRLISNSRFTDGLNGWTTWTDGATISAGYAAAEITASPQLRQPRYPALYQESRLPREGTRLWFAASINAQNITGKAFLEIDFFAADGRRIAVVVSPGISGTREWTAARFSTAVPRGTVRTAFKLVLTGSGTARFTDVQAGMFFGANFNFETGKSEPWQISAGAGIQARVGAGLGRDGSRGAVIVVPPSVPQPSWPAVHTRLQNIVPGEMVELSGWIRTERAAAQGQAGAYLAVSFYDQKGKRLSFAQTGGIKGSHEWSQQAVSAQAPAGTATVGINLHLNGSGAAYFDAIAVTVRPTARPVPAAAVRARPSNRVLNSRLAGFGHQLNPHGLEPNANPMTPAQRNTLQARTAELAPSSTRVFADYQWWRPGNFDHPMAQALITTCQFAAQNGARVNLVLWRPKDWDLNNLEAIANAAADAVLGLRRRGVKNVREITLYNEPIFEFPGNAAQYAQMHDVARSVFDKRGLSDVGLIAEAYEGPVAASLPAVNRVSDSWSYHRYVRFDGSLTAEVARYTAEQDRAATAGFTDYGVWETNIVNPGDSWTSGQVDGKLVVERFPSALKLALWLLHLTAAGANRVAVWDLLDYGYARGARPQNFGLFSSAATGLKARPIYATLRLVARGITAGSKLHEVQLNPANSLIAYAAVAANGRRRTWLANPWPTPVSVSLEQFANPRLIAAVDATTWQKYAGPLNTYPAARSATRLTLTPESLSVVDDR